jgi:hypothetical protein
VTIDRAVASPDLRADVTAAGAPGVPALVLTVAAAGVTAVAAGLTLLAPDVLQGEAVMDGAARGTSLALLCAVPVLLLAAWVRRRGVAQAGPVWLGLAFFVVYNAVMLLFGTPFNRLFLLYVAMLSLGLATAWALLSCNDAEQLASRLERAPRRAVSGYLLLVASLNAIVWLRGVVAGMSTPAEPTFLAGTGLPTSPLYVQDLAVWLPLATVAAVWLWRGEARGYRLSAAVLVLWVAESCAVISDQWFGYRADPTTIQASPAGMAVFAVLAVVGLVPLLLLLMAPPPAAPTTVIEEGRNRD